MRRPPPVLFAPALVAAYPAAFIWSANLGEITAADGVVVLLLLAAMGATVHAVIWAVSRRRMSAATAAVVAAVVNAALFAAGLIGERRTVLLEPKIAVAAALLLALATWLWWRGGDRPGLARAIGISMVALYGGLAFSVAATRVARHRVVERLASVPSLREEIATRAIPDSLPDIYLLLLDTYGSPEVLSSVYGVHNQRFRDSLRTLGFQVLPSRANYSGTAWTLASMLNVAYLDPLPPLLDGRAKGFWPLYALSRDDRTTRLLARLGYRSYIVPSTGWMGTAAHERATIHLTTPDVGVLRGHWMRGTLLFHVWPRTLAGRMLGDHARWSSRDRVIASFDGARQLIDEPGPKFVLVHSMTSHSPFSVDAECGAVEPPIIDTEAESWEGRAGYREGILCTDRLVLELVTDILRRARRPPVILVHGDHGPRALGITLEKDAASISAAQAVERLAVFGAYFLPGGSEVLGDSVTPVNMMRSVLRHYTGAELPPLPDRSFHATSDRPFRFVEIPASFFTDSARAFFGRADTASSAAPQPLN